MKTRIRDSINYLVAQSIPGAVSLLSRFDLVEREYDRVRHDNVWTEGMAIWFVQEELGFYVSAIEEDGNLISPNASGLKSCDIQCKDKAGSTVYIEVKDSSSDTLKAQKAGLRGYAPQCPSKIVRWLSNQVYDSVQKGANLLIVRFPVFQHMGRPIARDDLEKTVFGCARGQTEISVRISCDIPAWFRGIWVIQRDLHAFYTVKKI